MMTNGRGADKADGRRAGHVSATARASGDGDGKLKSERLIAVGVKYIIRENGRLRSEEVAEPTCAKPSCELTLLGTRDETH